MILSVSGRIVVRKQVQVKGRGVECGIIQALLDNPSVYE
jgi:hypothetical protein